MLAPVSTASSTSIITGSWSVLQYSSGPSFTMPASVTALFMQAFTIAWSSSLPPLDPYLDMSFCPGKNFRTALVKFWSGLVSSTISPSRCGATAVLFQTSLSLVVTVSLKSPITSVRHPGLPAAQSSSLVTSFVTCLLSRPRVVPQVLSSSVVPGVQWTPISISVSSAPMSQ